MEIKFQTLGKRYALEILSWRYSVPYDYYNFGVQTYDADLSYLTDPNNHFFAVVNSCEALEGFCSFGADGQVAGGDYRVPSLDIGMGIRPGLTGRGNGRRYAQAVAEYGIAQYEAKRLRVTIAEFNCRARRVWQGLGFEVTEKFLKTDSEMAFVVMTCEANSLHRRDSSPVLQ